MIVTADNVLPREPPERGADITEWKVWRVELLALLDQYPDHPQLREELERAEYIIELDATIG